MKKTVSILMMAIMLFMCGFTSTEANAATKVTLNKKTVSVRVGCNTKLQLKNATSTVTWKSADESIAKVSAKGTVTGIKKGTTKISATYKKKTYKCTVTVKSSKIGAANRILPVGQSYQFWVIKRSQKSNETVNDVKVSATVKWKSSDSKVAKVNKNGLVVAKKEGTAKITAKVKGETYSRTVTVVKPLGYDDFAYDPDAEMATTYAGYKITYATNPYWKKYDYSDEAKKYKHFSELQDVGFDTRCRSYTKALENDENRGIVIGDTIEEVWEKYGQADGEINQSATVITNWYKCDSYDSFAQREGIVWKMTYSYKETNNSKIVNYKKIFYFDQNKTLILIEWRMEED